MQDCKVNILGTEYSIQFVQKFPDRLNEFQEIADGLCNSYNREIYINNKRNQEMTDEGFELLQKKTLRHEIIHAFLFESGLSSNTSYCGAWAESEELVDWMAIQYPKILKVFNDVGAL